MIGARSSLDGKPDIVVDRAASLERKREIVPLSPSAMTATAGLAVKSDVQRVWRSDEIVAFPRSPQAEPVLKDKNDLPLQAETAIAGSVLDELAANSVKHGLDSRGTGTLPGLSRRGTQAH